MQNDSQVVAFYVIWSGNGAGRYSQRKKSVREEISEEKVKKKG